jgi:hypothetical protein
MLDKKSLNQLNSLFAGIEDPSQAETPPTKSRRASSASGGSSGWVWELDSEGNCLWCSNEIQALLGISPARARGHSLEASGLPPEAVARLRKAMSTGRSIDNFVLTAIHSNGEPVLLLINALPRFDDEGNASTYRAVVQVLQTQLPSQGRSRQIAKPKTALQEMPAPKAKPTRPVQETTKERPARISARASQQIFTEKIEPGEPTAYRRKPVIQEEIPPSPAQVRHKAQAKESAAEVRGRLQGAIPPLPT